MTIQDLIDELQAAITNGDVEPTDEVHIAQPTHDYWRHVKAEPVSSVDLFARVKHSTYNDGLILVDDEDEDHDTVLLLR